MTVHDFLDDDLRDQAALFVLDALPESDARRYRLHVARCDACRREVDSLAIAARELALVAPELRPEPAIWLRVVQRIRSDAANDTDGERSAAATSERVLSDAAMPPAGISGAATRAGDLRDTAEPAAELCDTAEPAAELCDTDGRQIWKRWPASATQADFSFVGAGEGRFEPTSYAGIEARRLFVDPVNDRVTMLVRMAAGSAYPPHVHGGPEECLVLAGDLRVGRDLRMRAGDFQRAEAGSEHDWQSSEGGCLLLITSSLHDELVS